MKGKRKRHPYALIKNMELVAEVLKEKAPLLLFAAARTLPDKDSSSFTAGSPWGSQKIEYSLKQVPKHSLGSSCFPSLGLSSWTVFSAANWQS